MIKLQFRRSVHLLALLGSSFLGSKAQVIDKTILTNAEPSILTKIYDITTKTNIDASTQKQLAFTLQNQENILADMIKHGKSATVIDSTKEVWQTKWMSLLSTKQQYYYSIATDRERNRTRFFFSQFSFAIQFKDSINLSENQEDSLFFKIDTLKRMKDAFIKNNPGKWFDSKAYESEGMTRLLTDSQYTKLLTIKNKEKAKDAALKDWKELELRNLTAKYDREFELEKLINYYIEKQNTYDRYAHDKIKQSAMIGYISSNKPKILNALIHARRNPANNTIGENY